MYVSVDLDSDNLPDDWENNNWLDSSDFNDADTDLDNQIRLQLFALTYNMGNFLRRLVLSRKRKLLTVQGYFCRIIDVIRIKLCFLSV